jgi:PAS domain S-box-containing protein
MPWVKAISEPDELRRCIRDLVALATLPAEWKTYDPQQIGESLAAALVSMLDCELVYICLQGRRDDPVIEVTRTAPGTAGESAGLLRAAVQKWLQLRTFDRTAIPSPLGRGMLHIAAAPIGLGIDAILVAGSHRPDFPTEVQRLLVSIAANDATIALQRWHAETDEQRFIELVENSSDFCAFAGLDGMVRYANATGLQLVGLAQLEEVGHAHVFDFLTPQARERARDQFWPRVMREGRWIGELDFRHFQTGAAIPFLVEWFRIDNRRTGKPMNIATVSRDLTAQKRFESELRRMAESLEARVSARTAELAGAHKELVAEISEREQVATRLHQLQLELFHAGRLSAAGEMAAALAHEINQPLAAITNSVHAARRLLQRREREEIATVCEALDEAAAQAIRAGQIVRRLRDFVNRSETEMEFENVTIMVEEACALALTGTGGLGLHVQFRFDPKVSEVFANRIQIQQVLVNLIRNAVEAMANSPRRELVLTSALTDHATIEIAVADRGSGLAHEVQENLFKPFVSTRRDGMGIGLSICRSIVEAHGGTLRAEPNEGGGTVFRFTLPVIESKKELHAG